MKIKLRKELEKWWKMAGLKKFLRFLINVCKIKGVVNMSQGLCRLLGIKNLKKFMKLSKSLIIVKK